MAQGIPFDAVHLVLDEVKHTAARDHTDLWSCSQVSRIWQEAAAPHVYKSLKVTLPDHHTDALFGKQDVASSDTPLRKTWNSLSTFLQESKLFQEHLLELRIQRVAMLDVTHDIPVRDFVTIINNLPRLRSLEINGFVLDHTHIGRALPLLDGLHHRELDRLFISGYKEPAYLVYQKFFLGVVLLLAAFGRIDEVHLEEIHLEKAAEGVLAVLPDPLPNGPLCINKLFLKNTSRVLNILPRYLEMVQSLNVDHVIWSDVSDVNSMLKANKASLTQLDCTIGEPLHVAMDSQKEIPTEDLSPSQLHLDLSGCTNLRSVRFCSGLVPRFLSSRRYDIIVLAHAELINDCRQQLLTHALRTLRESRREDSSQPIDVSVDYHLRVTHTDFVWNLERSHFAWLSEELLHLRQSPNVNKVHLSVIVCVPNARAQENSWVTEMRDKIHEKVFPQLSTLGALQVVLHAYDDSYPAGIPVRVLTYDKAN